MEQAIRLVSPGPEGALYPVAWPRQEPGAGEVRLRQEIAGVNFIDSYHRTGLYPLPAPFIPGVEGVGRIEAVGAGVEALRVGQRVAYCAEPGGYATTRLLPAWRALPLPETIPSEVAAASMLRGMTAHMLLGDIYPVREGSSVLIRASAGGLGGLLTRWAKHLGAIVIGTVGTREKIEIARTFGADHVIVGREADLAGEVDALTGGAGVDLAIDGIGGKTLRQTLAAVRADGTVASIGQAAGPIPALTVADIAPRRAVRFVRPSIMAHAADPGTYHRSAEAVFAMIERGIAVEVGRTYPLAQAADALRELESGAASGARLLAV